MDIKERFKNAIDTLYKNACNLATEVTKLGYPALSNNIPTAAVGWDKEQQKVRFEFNEEFASKLNDDEFAFVVGHEATHLAICHIFLIGDRIESIKRNAALTDIEKASKCNVYMMKANIAADCVVNDSLVNIYKLAPQLVDMAVYGKKTVGIDCHNLSMEEVYQLLPETKEYTFDVHNWESFMDKNGKIDKGFADKIRGFIDRNLGNSALSDEENRKLEESAKILEESLPAGSAPLGQRREIIKTSRKYANWNKLLLDIVDAKKDEDKWSRPNRKLISFYPEVILPRYEPAEIEQVFVAIDASGSINRDQLSLFVDVVRNSPKRFKINAVTFDTQCYPLDIMKQDPVGGGGTCFAAIEEYIQKELPRYPKAVFVLTDGHGTSVTPQHPERWAWVLTDNYSEYYCKNMKRYKIKELLKQ